MEWTSTATPMESLISGQKERQEPMRKRVTLCQYNYFACAYCLHSDAMNSNNKLVKFCVNAETMNWEREPWTLWIFFSFICFVFTLKWMEVDECECFHCFFYLVKFFGLPDIRDDSHLVLSKNRWFIDGDNFSLGFDISISAHNWNPLNAMLHKTKPNTNPMALDCFLCVSFPSNATHSGIENFIIVRDNGIQLTLHKTQNKLIKARNKFRQTWGRDYLMKVSDGKSPSSNWNARDLHGYQNGTAIFPARDLYDFPPYSVTISMTIFYIVCYWKTTFIWNYEAKVLLYVTKLNFFQYGPHFFHFGPYYFHYGPQFFQ